MRNTKLLFWVACLLLLVNPAFSLPGAISPGDRIHVWVKGEPDLTLDRVVESDGSITFPLVGNIGVAGMSVAEAGKVIARMLDDGYLRNPLVQVDFVSAGERTDSTSTSQVRGEPLTVFSGTEQTNSAQPLEPQSEPEPQAPAKSVQIEVINQKTGEPVGNAALLLGGKIYQSNRLGQMLLEVDQGSAVLLADGYEVLQGDIKKMLRSGRGNRIVLPPVSLALEIAVKVVDQKDGAPLSNVQVLLNKTKIRTNSQGTFKVKELAAEFGEVVLTKKGYKTVKKILDFKDPGERTIPMIRDD